MYLQGRPVISAISVIAIAASPLMACGGNGAAEKAEPKSSASPGTSNFDDIPGQIPANSTTTPAGQAAAPVGRCANITGPRADSKLEVVDCVSAGASYKIVQRVAYPTECVADVDKQYYHGGVDSQWAACLDYLWKSDQCLSVTKDLTMRVQCNDHKAQNVQLPTKVILNTTTTANCLTGGFAHPVRRFTVCTETQP